jgi:hypothetical protein
MSHDSILMGFIHTVPRPAYPRHRELQKVASGRALRAHNRAKNLSFAASQKPASALKRSPVGSASWWLTYSFGKKLRSLVLKR